MNPATTVFQGVELQFTQTVPCHLTHRRAVGEVFVTDSAQLDADTFLTAIQLPRAHRLWSDRSASHHDVLAVIEAGRQATFLCVHRYLGVPLGVPFVLGKVDFQVCELEAFRDRGHEPFEAVLRLWLTQRAERAGMLTSMTFRGELWVRSAAAMTLGGEIQFLSRADYDLMRAFSRARKKLTTGSIPPLPTRIECGRAGRNDAINIVIGSGRSAAGESVHPVIVDRSHPSFFDHGQDHAPGPLILEAYRQAAIATALEHRALIDAHVAVTAAELEFFEFSEFEAPTECSARLLGPADDGAVKVQLHLHQCRSTIGSGVYTLAPCVREA